MNLFYTPADLCSATELSFTEEEAHHLSKVLRYKEGDKLLVTDGVGHVYKVEIQRISKRDVSCKILNKEHKPKPNHPVLAVGFIKHRQRLEFLVEKAVEIGVESLVFFSSDHSERDRIRIDRLEAIMTSAMKQSLRFYLPQIQVFESLDEVVAHHALTHSLYLAHEKADAPSGFVLPLPENRIFMIGPEGGFSQREVDLLSANNGTVIKLGEYRLRAETAALIMLGMGLG